MKNRKMSLLGRNYLKGSKMRNNSASGISTLMLAMIMTAAVSVSCVGVSDALAESKNYIKISANAIGQTKRLNVGLNKSMVIDLPAEAHDILVANPDVADAITRTSRRIYVFAKQVGETNIFIFDASGKQLLSLDLKVERDIEGLETYLEKYIPGSNIKVEIVNDNIILTGTVPTPQTASKAVELAQVFVTGGAATTPNDYSRSSDGSGSLIINFGDDERVSQIVNLLQIDAEDQVNLKVTVAEIQRTIVKQLGIDLYSAGGTIGGITTGFISDNPFALGKIGSSSSISASGNIGNASLEGMVQALNQAGVMRTLAEPSLTAISGESASFSVGGSYPTSAGKSDGGISADGEPATVSYNSEKIDYGISLNFTPVVLSPGRISLRIATSVSEPTSESSYAIPRGAAGAAATPGIRRREASTTVELPSGGSMVIAGLLKDDVRQTISGFPGLSRIPVLGTLFRSREYQRYESELVIIVTPYLVRPVARQALARPDDNFNPAHDSSGMFLGRVNRIYGTAEGKLPKGRYHGNPGFIFK